MDHKIKQMYDSGMSMRAIERATGLSKSTICCRIANFALENTEQDMPQTDKKTTLVTDQDAQARTEELEVKLRKAELARDAYDEMINVAEAKFNIPIGKSWRQTVENLHAKEPAQYKVQAFCELFGIFH